MKSIDNWREIDTDDSRQILVKRYTFKDFERVFSFIDRVGKVMIKHHKDSDINISLSKYNVLIVLNPYGSTPVKEKHHLMAERLDSVLSD